MSKPTFDPGVPRGRRAADQPTSVPSRKWIVAQITTATALLTMWATTGSWDTEETVALIGLVSQAAISYLTPNAPSQSN